MNVLDHSCFAYLEKKGILFTMKLPNIIYYRKFCKNTLHHAKITTLCLYFEHEYRSNEMFQKVCVSLGDIFWR